MGTSRKWVSDPYGSIFPYSIFLSQENRTSIYLGTDYEVAKMNYDVCTNYKKIDNCIHDVLCYWCNDTNEKACRSWDYYR